MRSAGAAEHRTGEHPAKRTLAPDRPRATLPLWVTGSASWPRCHHAEPQPAKGAQARFAEISARSAARSVSGLVQPGRKRSAQRGHARRPIRHRLFGGCSGATRAPRRGWA